jgi:hypothetical protein
MSTLTDFRHYATADVRADVGGCGGDEELLLLWGA